MKQRVKRIGMLLLSGILAMAMAGCQPAGEPGKAEGNETGSQEGKLFSQPVAFDMVISSHASWPYNENWKLWQYFKEATGAELNIQAIPASDTATKLPLMMASPESLPDLIHLWAKEQFDPYALTGAFVCLDDHMDQMPNMKTFLDSLPDTEREDLLNQRKSGDGKIYSAPCYGTQTMNNIRGWMYRKDIFEKHGLSVPTTYEEMYQVCKKLKALYPESYPLCFRSGLPKLEDMGPSWKNDYTYQAYYDFVEKEWRYGAQEPVLRDMIEYFLKMKTEGLVPPDFITIETKSWEELMSTDRGFITLDYLTRIDFFNVPNREENPEYTLAMMAPPAADVATGSQKLKKTNLDFGGYVICNTGDQKMMDNSLKLVDWMYTDEGCELLSWGKEGETYEVVDGKKKFILKEGEQPQIAYGVGTYGLYQRIDEEAYEASYSQENVEACRATMPYLETYANPTMWIPFSDEEASRATQLVMELKSYCDEEISKFMLGQKPLTEWDAFQTGLTQMGVDELLKLYSQAYDRVVSE